jgi:hypothetical protein
MADFWKENFDLRTDGKVFMKNENVTLHVGGMLLCHQMTCGEGQK